MSTKTALYPTQHEDLLRKAGLLRTGKLEIRGIHRIREHHVSEDGLTFEKVRRPDESDILKGGSHLVYNSFGQIAGYWANSLTESEREVIHKECGVPYFYLGSPVNPMTQKPEKADTYIHIKEGEVLDLTIPAQVAKALVLMELPGLIGINRQDAANSDAMFFFYSIVEEQKEKRLEIKERVTVSKLVGELTKAEKKELIQIMSFNGDISADPYMKEENASILFDELCFTMPSAITKAHLQERKDDFICVKTLISSGHIESGGHDGPFYKNPAYYGARTHLADNLEQLMVRIDTHPDLIKVYKEIEGHVKNGTTSVQASTENIIDDLLAMHAVHEEVDGTELNIAKANKKTLFKYMADSGIGHSFTNDSNIEEIRNFIIDNQ